MKRPVGLRGFTFVLILLFFSCCGMGKDRENSSSIVAVSFDLSETYQEIAGFGAFGLRDVNWGDPAAGYREKWAEQVFTDLGLTITRNEWYPSSTTERQDSNWAQQKPNVKAFNEKACSMGIPLKQIIAVWSPPGEWKTNGSTKGGGHLLPGHYSDFANWLADCIQAYQDAGIAVYGISPQNEPTLSTFYNSCVYTPAEYVAMIKVAGPVLRRRFPDVKIMGPDTASLDQTHTRFNESIEKALIDDPEAGQYIDVWLIHGYVWKPFPKPLQTKEYWETLHNRLKGTGKPLWMTELSYFTGGMDLAESVYMALKHGNVSGWVWWQLGENPGNAQDFNQSQYTLMRWDRPTQRYYAAKQFYRYIRPGAVRIKCDVDHGKLWALAFKHPSDHTVTFVLINPSNQAETALISGGLPEPLNAVRTSATEKCAEISPIDPGKAFEIPPKSITTIYGTL